MILDTFKVLGFYHTELPCTVYGVYYRAGNFHARGHGLQTLGDVDQDELDRKRLKTLEHQVSSLVVLFFFLLLFIWGANDGYIYLHNVLTCFHCTTNIQCTKLQLGFSKHLTECNYTACSVQLKNKWSKKDDWSKRRKKDG